MIGNDMRLDPGVGTRWKDDRTFRWASVSPPPAHRRRLDRRGPADPLIAWMTVQIPFGLILFEDACGNRAG